MPGSKLPAKRRTDPLPRLAGSLLPFFRADTLAGVILAYHAIFATYGFWLPNDPRGSWSDFVGSWELLKFGRATTTDTRRSVAAPPHNAAARQAARRALKYPPAILNGLQARAVGHGFHIAAKESGCAIHACSILPEHVHIVVGRHTKTIENMVAHLKAKASTELRKADLHPFVHDDQVYQSVWADGRWKVFLDAPDDVQRAIKYVEDNPLKEGKPRQRWQCVTPWFE